MAGAPEPHHRTAAAFLLVSVLAGLLSGVFSLLFRLPPGRIPVSAAAVRLLAEGHAPLMLLGGALPALLGGMGLLLVPGAVGARTTAFPRLSAAAAVLVAGGTLLFASGLVASRPVLLPPALICWVSGLVLCASDLLATVLDHRAPHATALPLFTRAAATACPLAIVALPVLLGCALRLPPGTGLLHALTGALCWPALLPLVVLLLGLVGDILAGDGPAGTATSARCGWILAAAAAAAFLVWCAPVLAHGAPHPGLLRALLLLPAVLVLPLSASAAIRNRFLFRLLRAPELHVAGFLLVAAASAIWTLAAGLRFPAHYALSAGAAFALLAGLYRWLDDAAPRSLPPILMRCQFVLLLAGIHLMLLPSSIPAALGAACCAVSLLLLAAILFFCLRPTAPRGLPDGYAAR